MNQAPKTVWTNPWHFIAFGFGIGAVPFAPGTFATIATIPLFMMMAGLSLPIYITIVLIAFILSCWICDFVSKEIGVHDHKGMVIDEIVGYLITMIGLPAQPKWIILGVILFRIFDILKPWPICVADRKIKGGFGVMFDDVLAAVVSCAILHLIYKFYA